MTRAGVCLILCASAAVAAHAEEIPWANLCTAAHARELTIVKTDGIKERGLCTLQTVDGITLGSESQISRSDIKTVRLDKRTRPHTKARLMSTASDLTLGGIVVLVTPYFVAGPPLLVAALATFLAAPFGGLFDLLTTPGSTQLTII